MKASKRTPLGEYMAEQRRDPAWAKLLDDAKADLSVRLDAFRAQPSGEAAVLARMIGEWLDDPAAVPLAQQCREATRLLRESAAVLAAIAGAKAPDPDALPLPEFDDPRVQAVYDILCDDAPYPENGEHWEGAMARRIVAKLGDTSAGLEQAAAMLANATPDDLRLMGGEFTPGEMRTTRAVLAGFAAAIRRKAKP